jgi:hypothetical protein
VAASEGFKIALDPESFGGLPKRPAAGQSVVHVVRMGKPVVSLVAGDQAILRPLLMQAIDLTRADFAFDGTFDEIILWSDVGEQEWESISGMPEILSYCRLNGDGRLVTLSGPLLRRYPKIRETLSPSCPHAFLVSRSVTLFETRPGY